MVMVKRHLRIPLIIGVHRVILIVDLIEGCNVIQVEAARPFSKYSARPSSVGQIPFFVEKVGV